MSKLALRLFTSLFSAWAVLASVSASAQVEIPKKLRPLLTQDLNNWASNLSEYYVSYRNTLQGIPARTVDSCPLPNEVPRSAALIACGKTYQEFYRAGERFDARSPGESGVIHIGVFFGYYNVPSHGVVLAVDMQTRDAFTAALIQACPAKPVHVLACGFAPEGQGQFHKDIRGPDGLPKRVVVHVESSSLSFFDSQNRKNPEQEKHSEEVRIKYLEALKNYDVVIYSGHSRNGGGPDFHVPRLIGDEADLRWYRDHKVHTREMLDALSRRDPGKPKIVMFNSCDSKLHFERKIRAVAPDLGIVDTLNEVGDDSEPEALGLINSLLAMDCQQTFMGWTQAEEKSFHLKGFFKPVSEH